jgi:hypothetical protein
MTLQLTTILNLNQPHHPTKSKQTLAQILAAQNQMMIKGGFASTKYATERTWIGAARSQASSVMTPRLGFDPQQKQ